MNGEIGLGKWFGGIFAAALVLLVAVPTPAGATWPGTNGKIYFVCREDGVGFSGQDICTINADGSGLSNLTDTPTTTESEPEVSIDGSQVSFTRSAGLPGDHVWVMNADGTNQRQVTTVESTGTSWTPGGKIAYRAQVDSTFEFRLVPAAGGASTLLKPALGSYSPPRFTIGGRWLYGKFAPVTIGSPTESQQVFVVNGDTETQVTASSPVLNSNTFPSWSPDGTTILYNRLESGDDDVFSVPSAGGPETRLTDTSSPIDERWASLSPDGTKLIYQGEDADNDFFSQFLTIANADGSNPIPIATPTLDAAQFPVWAPARTSGPPAGKAAFTATAPKTSKSSGPVKLTLRCIGGTRCAVAFSAKLTVERKGRAPKRFAIQTKRVTLNARTRRVVEIRIPAAARRPVSQALKVGRKPSLRVTAAATQPDGPRIRTVNLNVKLTR